MDKVVILTVGISLFASFVFSPVHGIGCYKCTTSGNDTSCSDPFNPGDTDKNLYEFDCKSGMEGRTGYFPARYCLKVSGIKADTGEQLVIRTCTVNKLLDSDSFISSFTLKLDGANDIRVTSGLIASCKDDGCNSAPSTLKDIQILQLSIGGLLLAFFVNRFV